MIAALCVAALFAPPAPAATPQWVWISAPRTEIHRSAATSAAVAGTAPQGARVRVREASGEGTSRWLHVVHAASIDGWIPAWDASETRPLPPPAIVPPAHRRNGASVASRPRAPIDHRALDTETTIAGPAAARAPEDDLVDLQLIVDGLYLDPRTFQPSPAMRAEDAKRFGKGLQ